MSREKTKSDMAIAGVPGTQGKGRDYFPKVREAREALAERAKEILEQYLLVVKDAHADGNYQVATESLQWLMEHMPMVENERMIDVHIDHQITSKATVGPNINIGFKLGGMPGPVGELPPAPTVTIIDADDDGE